MQRYQPSLAWIDNNAFAHADEDADGDFVLYADAKSAIDAAARENARLRAELQNIANAKTHEPGNDWSAEFEAWAKNRARAALSALDAKGGG